MCRKVKLLLLSLIFLVPFMVFAEDKVENTNHSGDVYIASSELIKASDGVEEIEKPTLKDLDVKFNVRFSEVNQSIEYKLIIKNTSNKDYNISTDNSFNKSDYITYNFKYDDGSDIIKANSEEEMLVTITYTKEVPSDKLTDGKFIEDNAMSLNLSDEITNPSTILQRYGVNILLIIITCVVSFYFLKEKNIKNSLKVLILGLILIPLATRALDTIKVTIDSHVEIETEGEFCYKTEINEGIANGTTPSEYLTEVKALYKYRKGMTWEEYLNSDYNKITDSTTISYNNKKIKIKDYLEQEIEDCKNNGVNPTSCPIVNYDNIHLFGITRYYEDYNRVLNIAFNRLPNYFHDENREGKLNEFDNQKLLESEIMDSSQGCYEYWIDAH